ncbi:MAG: inner membrane protein, partial [Sphingomonadales bacterium]|nr:inner membrane protein [Sphingomonadales bacterium]
MTQERSPGNKLILVILVAVILSVPLFMVWLIVYDRQSQSEVAQQSIAEGWAGPQTIAGPLLVIPYRVATTETVVEGNRQVTRAGSVERELTLAPELADLAADVRPERISRSIYEAVVYEAAVRGRARFAIPQDLSRLGVRPETLDL